MQSTHARLFRSELQRTVAIRHCLQPRGSARRNNEAHHAAEIVRGTKAYSMACLQSLWASTLILDEHPSFVSDISPAGDSRCWRQRHTRRLRVILFWHDGAESLASPSTLVHSAVQSYCKVCAGLRLLTRLPGCAKNQVIHVGPLPYGRRASNVTEWPVEVERACRKSAANSERSRKGNGKDELSVWCNAAEPLDVSWRCSGVGLHLSGNEV